MGPLKGLKIIEMAGIGPGPFCGMVLADLGAEVIRVDRASAAGTGSRQEPANRGKRSIAVDLKSQEGVEVVLKLVEGSDAIFEGLNQLTVERNDITIVYPVHPNPNVKKCALKYFKNNSDIHLVEPLSYGAFIWLLKKSYLILTDSGGIQEEAPSLGKPVLVLREVTERPEAVEAGTVILVGTDKDMMKQITHELLDNTDLYNKMSAINNPYGDGKATERIVEYFINKIDK